MTPKLTLEQTRYLRARAQHLTKHDPQADPVQVVRSVIGIQAQELPSAYLAIRARSRGVTETQLRQITFDQSQLVWTWCMRGTLHLVTAEDIRWINPLLREGLLPPNDHRLTQLGWNRDTIGKGIDIILNLLKDEGEQTRAQIAQALAKYNLPFEGQATVHIVFRAVIEGLVAITGLRGSKPVYGLFERHLGDLNPLPRDEAVQKLASRYLLAYGPARMLDFVTWSGIKATEVKPLWDVISSQTSAVEIDGYAAHLPKNHLAWLEDQTSRTPALRLLPRYDDYLLGYANRTWTVEPGLEERLLPGGGIIPAVIVLDGLVVGAWKLIPGPKQVQIELDIFSSQKIDLKPMIEEEVADIQRFLGREVSFKMMGQA